jgi:hypothetical protein
LSGLIASLIQSHKSGSIAFRSRVL